MNILLQVFQQTPWWVFPLFFYLMKIGIDATKPRIFKIRYLFILPVVLLAFSINSLLFLFSVSLVTLAIYFSFLLLGAFIGWALVRNLKLRFDHIHHLIGLPGSFTTLICILAIFPSKYYLNYLIATHPGICATIEFAILHIGLSSAYTGLFLGRLIGYLIHRSRSTHENLQEGFKSPTVEL